MAQKSKTEFLYTVLSYGFSKFLLKIIVSNSFKTLPRSDSSVLFFFFFFFFVVWNWDKSNSQLSFKGYREYLHTDRVDNAKKIFFALFLHPFYLLPLPPFWRMGPSCPWGHFKMSSHHLKVLRKSPSLSRTLVYSGNFRIFKNTLGQFIPNRPSKHDY